MYSLRPLTSVLASLLLGGNLSAAAVTPVVPTRPNVAMHYTVDLTRNPAQAHIASTMTGGNEIKRIRFLMPAERFQLARHTGTWTKGDNTFAWWEPADLTGIVEYTAALDHRRNGKGYDSYHTDAWVIARAKDLFPERSYQTTAPVNLLTRVSLVLPPHWTAHTALQPIGSNRFEAHAQTQGITRPYGWMIAGDLSTTTAVIGATTVVIASPRAVGADHQPILSLLQATLPHLARITHAVPSRLLIVVGPDPMWRGGLSGEDSLFLHAKLPLIASDQTSTLIHELFHVCQGFDKATEQSDWIIEGLAEYYSLRLLRLGHVLSGSQWKQGIKRLAKQAVWWKNFSATADHAILYNSAPLVLFAIDQTLQQASQQRHRLDDVVTRLAEQGTITNQTLLTQLQRITPEVDWTHFFRRHIEQGHPPDYEQWLK